jgi:hypothetical protein
MSARQQQARLSVWWSLSVSVSLSLSFSLSLSLSLSLWWSLSHPSASLWTDCTLSAEESDRCQDICQRDTADTITF